ncbi:MAG TPA: fibronectin type III domain-containing protein [Candidatus Limnocylindria bacterium]|nr:fibronectin type III domain-containing protein [Candidatus Limnocylindria bacterium]
MKKSLAAALCAALLLALLPAAVPPAQMAIAGIVYANVSSAYVGDTIHWLAYGARAENIGFYQLLYVFGNGDMLHYENFGGAPKLAMPFQPRFAGHYAAMHFASDTARDDTSFSPVVRVSLRPAPKNVTVAPVNGTALKITWGAVPGAGGYEVWRSEFRAGPYALVRATTATSWSNTYLTPGNIYYYQVRSTNLITVPLNEGSVPSGNFSAPVGSIPLGKAAIQSATATGTDRVKLVITPVPGASGYQILVSPTAGGTYKVLRKVSASTLTITGLTPNTAYYFKVQAYRTVSAGTFFGALSAYRGVRTLK